MKLCEGVIFLKQPVFWVSLMTGLAVYPFSRIAGRLANSEDPDQTAPTGAV